MSARPREIGLASHPLSHPLFRLSLSLFSLSFYLSSQTALHQSKVDSGNRHPTGESTRHPGEDTPGVRARGPLDALHVL